MNRLATLSLNNRSFIALVCIAVSIIGMFIMTTMRQELIPSVSLPQIQVMTTAPGSTSEQVRDRITSPVEQSLSGLENVEGTSSSTQAGLSMVTVELTYGSDVARASNQVDAALTRIEDQLPEEADPQVISGGTSDLPAVVLSVSSDLDPSDLATRLESSVTSELERVDGVSSVAVIGAPEEIVRITPDEGALAENGLTENDISTALDAHGLSLPGGSVVDGDRTLDVVLGQNVESIESLEQIVLMPAEGGDAGQQGGQDGAQPGQEGQDGQGAPGADGQFEQPDAQPQEPAEPITLAEVASVERTTQDATSISRTNGRESLVLMVTATVDGNVVDVSEGVEGVLADTLEGVGGNAEADVVFDQAPFIQESILALAEEGLLGLLFAVGVILLFLRRVRPTVVTAISIPTSLLIAFIGMYVTGYTLNMLTLAALTISIGRVVDDSIVVIENITRHLAYGKTKRRAILDGVQEVAGAITASTLATVVVFLPVAVVAGMAGELFRPFALTVGIAMMSSLLVALTIVPVLAYWFLKPPKGHEDVDPDDPAQVTAARERAEAKEESTWLHRMYAPVLRLVLDTLPRRLITVGASILVLVGTVFLIPLVNISFLGDTGQNIASLTQTLPAGTNLEQSSREGDRERGGAAGDRRRGHGPDHHRRRPVRHGRRRRERGQLLDHHRPRRRPGRLAGRHGRSARSAARGWDDRGRGHRLAHRLQLGGHPDHRPHPRGSPDRERRDPRRARPAARRRLRGRQRPAVRPAHRSGHRGPGGRRTAGADRGGRDRHGRPADVPRGDRHDHPG